jgi:hypothetical protein
MMIVGAVLPNEVYSPKNINETELLLAEHELKRTPFSLFNNAVVQNGVQWFSLIVMIAISILIPAFVIFYFGEVRGYFGPDAVPPDLKFLGRAIQFVFIAIAGMLPGLLYFLFDRQRLGVLRKEVEHNIFRLDASIKTLGDVHAKYGDLIEEFYGSANNIRRIAGGTRIPIIIATAMLSVGMIMTLLPVGIIIINEPFDLYTLLLPRQTTFSLGFTGAYFFTLITVLRRYSLGDLRPKTYSHITVRIVTVIVLAWVLDILITLNTLQTNALESISNQLENTFPITLIIAFLIGIVPETFWTLLREISSNIPFLSVLAPTLKTDDTPLTEIEGIDLYERARLYEEGIGNLQGLVHYDIISLMLKSRIPSARIVDWVDQAILELHVTHIPNIEPEHTQVKVREWLGKRGIRNITDLTLYSKAPTEQQQRNEIDIILEDIQKIVVDDEWFHHVQTWRQSTKIEDRKIIIDKADIIQIENS